MIDEIYSIKETSDSLFINIYIFSHYKIIHLL